MYKNKNKNKGVRISLIVALFAVLIGCLCVFAGNPFSVANTAKADALTPSYGEVSAPAGDETGIAVASEDGISAQSAADMLVMWQSAVEQSLSGGGRNVTFKLTEDWTATASGSNSSFGSGTGFSDGSLYVPKGASIILDLNGHTINRNLVNMTPDGNVIKVEGLLELENNASAKAYIRGGNDSNGAGGGISIVGGTVYMADNISITDNYAMDLGGGVYVCDGGAFYMDGGEITNNTANYGGGINVETGTVSLNGTISGNTALTNGGGVWFTDGSLTIGEGCTITNNACTANSGGGGGVYVEHTNTTLMMSDGKISDNRAGYGGGVFVMGARFTMSGGEISNNTAQTSDGYGMGGGVYVDYDQHGDGTSFTMNGGTISGNYASNYGGGVYMGDDTVLNMTGGTISGNRSERGGGGMYLSSPNILGYTISGVTITSNTAQYGGGLYLFDSGDYVILNGFDVSGNSATVGGDVSFEIYMSSYWARMISFALANPRSSVGGVVGNFSANSTTHSFGTGTGFSNGRLHIPQGINIKLALNSATINRGLTTSTSYGGVFYVEGNLEIYGTGKITGGYSLGGVGGIEVDGGNLVLNGGTITGNKVDYNGGSNSDKAAGVGVLNGGSFTMNGGTISANTPGVEAGGGVCVDDGTFIMNGGIITNNGHSGSDCGGGVFVGTHGSFIMNDGTISDNAANSGGGVESYGAFTMNGGTITNNSASYNGGGVDIWYGTFIMRGGKITGNTAGQGGGVSIFYNATFTMHSGEISGNNTTAGGGGGVYVYDGQLTMSDGIISGNTATGSSDGGGGVFVYNDGEFVMNGGSITDNAAPAGAGGGGVRVYGIFTMNGGSIVYNTASAGGAGVYLTSDSSSTFNIGGVVEIYNNIVGTATVCNVYVANGKVINITGNITGSKIGIYMNQNTGTFTSGYGARGNNSSYATLFFYSDKSAYKVSTTGSGTSAEVTMVSGTQTTPTITIVWRYSTDSTFATYESTTAISASIPYDGLRYYVRAYRQDTGAQITISAYSYKLLNGSTSTSSAYAIQNAGTYSFVVNSTSYTNPTFSFTITPKEVNVEWSNTELVYNGSMQYPIATVVGALNSITLTYDTANAGTNAGSGYSVSAASLVGSYAYCYRLAGTISHTYSISKAKLDKPVVLGYNTFAYTGETLTLKFATYDTTLIGITGNTGVNADNYTATASLLDTTNYTWSDGTSTDVSYSWSITPKILVKPSIDGYSVFTYNGSEQGIELNNFDSEIMSVGGTDSATNVGEYTAEVTLTDTKNYQWADYTTDKVELNWEIAAKYIYITGVSVENKEYDGTTSATVDTSKINLGGVAEADLDKLTVVFTDEGNQFDGSSVGMHYIIISGIELKNTTDDDIASNYIFDFDEVKCYAQIYPATIKITGVAAVEKEYDGTTYVEFDLDNIDIEGVVEAEKEDLIKNLIVNGYFDDKNAGDGVKVIISGYRLGGQYQGNYMVDLDTSDSDTTADISKAEIEVTLGDTEYTVTYGNGLKITYSQNSPVKSESVNLTLEYWDEKGNAKIEGVPTQAGTYLVRVVVDENDPNLANYTIKTTGDGLIYEAKVTIEKATLTVTVENLTIEYGDALPATNAYTLVYNGWLNGDAAAFENGTIKFTTPISISTTYDPTDEDNRGVGSYDIELDDGELANYELNFVNGTLNVAAKKVTVKIDNLSSAYGEDIAEYTSNAASLAAYKDDDLGITLSRGDDEGKTGVAKYIISGTSSNGNYDVTFVNGIYEITKATLTVTAKDFSITYGDEADNDGVDYGTFAFDEDEDDLDGTLEFRYTYTQYGDIYESDGVTKITYYIIPYGLESDNYEIEFVNGVLEVKQASATVSVSNTSTDIGSVISDREEAAQTIKYTVTGTVNGDNLQVVLTIAPTGENGVYSVNWCGVGVYKVTGAADNKNYDVTFEYEDGEKYGTYTVTTGKLIITANTLILSYGDKLAFGSDIDLALSVEGLPSGATLQSLIDSGVISAAAFGISTNAADYDAYKSMGSMYTVGDDIYDEDGNRISYIVLPTGLVSSSYTIEFKPGKLMIEPKSIVVTLDDKSSVYGEKDVDLTASVEAGALVNFDPDNDNVVDFLAIQDLKRATGTDAGYYAITASGADNKNYRVTFVIGVYTIEQYEVTIVWVSGNEDDSDFTYTYNGKDQAPLATFTMPNPADPDNPLVYTSADLTNKLIEITGSGLNAGGYKAQAFLLDSNLKFAAGTDIVKTFTIEKKQLTVTWYAESNDIGDETKAIIASSTKTTPIEYEYRVGYPWAPVASLDGFEGADATNASSYFYVSGEQNAANISGSYEAVLHILNPNYTVAADDMSIWFKIVVSSPDDFDWYDEDGGNKVSGNVPYVYNGDVQFPVAKAQNYNDFIYHIYAVVNGVADTSKEIKYPINVGSYQITAVPVNNNYQLDPEKATITFEISAAVVTVTWDTADLEFEYNGQKQVPTAYYTFNGQNYPLQVVLSGDGIDAGDYDISVTLGSSNFAFEDEDGNKVDTLKTKYTITGKNIEVKWESKYVDDDGNPIWSVVYGEDESESVTVSATMQGAADGNVAISIEVYYQASEKDSPVLIDRNIGMKNAGIYTLCLKLSDSDNYQFSNDASQTFVIEKKSLTINAVSKEVSTGGTVPVLTATFGENDFAKDEDAVSLGLTDENGAMSWLTTNYDSSKPYIDKDEYTDANDIDNLVYLSDVAQYKGYYIVLTDSVARLAELNKILSNYDWTFNYGLMIINAVEGDVSIVLSKEYNGENQTIAAQYRVGNTWVDLYVEVYNEDYTQKIENPDIKDVGTYHILLRKYDTTTNDGITLKGAETSGEFAGCVKETFTITPRVITVKISDKSVVYGNVTSDNYEADYLASLWSYASTDNLYRPLGNDDLEISLSVNFTFDAEGYAIVNTIGSNVVGYDITGSWSEDEVLRNNYLVKFEGSNGDKGVFTITNAKISYYDRVGDYDQIVEQDGSMKMSLATLLEDGTYKYFSFAGNSSANVEIYYGYTYSLDNNNPDSFRPENDLRLQNKELSIAPDFTRTGSDSRYFTNFMIVIANHETYYGQWMVEVLSDTIYIKIVFLKEYEITFGDSVPDGKELASALWNGGYIDKNETGIQNKFQEYIDNDIVTARVVTDTEGLLNSGKYSIVFEGLENVSDGKYEVTYRQDVNDNVIGTNVDKFVVNQSELTITWGDMTFVYDGEAHLPVPAIEGWNLLGSSTDGNVTVYRFGNEETGLELSLTVRTNGGDFTSIGSENIVIAEIDDENYKLDSLNATRAVSIIGDNNSVDPVTPEEPVVTSGGIPAWVAGLLGGLAALLLIILILALLKRRKSENSDEDGFYDDVKEGD